MTDRLNWKLVIKHKDGREDVKYYYTEHEMAYPAQRARHAGAVITITDLDEQRGKWREQTSDLLERVRSGMTTLKDATLIEAFLYSYNSTLPEPEKFLEE